MASCPYLNPSMVLSKPKQPAISLDFLNSQDVSSSLSFTASPIRVVRCRSRQTNQRLALQVMASMDKPKMPLKVMISGAPASGKGTQCELITSKYDLVHVAAGDLLRAEIAAGSESGIKAKEYMEKGQLVPDEIVVMILLKMVGYWMDTQEAHRKLQLFKPLVLNQTFLYFLKLDPVTGRIYHLTYSPPETEEIAARLTQRFDDTEEKVKLRLQTHNQNVESVLSLFEDITVKVDGSLPKEEVFAQIDSALSNLTEQKDTTLGVTAT